MQLSWLLHSWVCEEMRLRYDFETIETVRLKQVTIHKADTLQQLDVFNSGYEEAIESLWDSNADCLHRY